MDGVTGENPVPGCAGRLGTAMVEVGKGIATIQPAGTPTPEAAAHRVAGGAPSPWVCGPVWDGVWMLSAIWLVPLALWLTYGHADPESSPLDLLFFALTALFWIGHRLCSTWLAYC